MKLTSVYTCVVVVLSLYIGLEISASVVVTERQKVHSEINTLRDLHGAEPLTLGGTISGRASKVARECLSDFLKDVILHPVDGSFLHENGWENVGTTVNVMGQDLDEYSMLHGTFLRILKNQKYDYTQPENETNEHTQAFTQMIWANTQEIDYAYVQVKETDVTGKVNTVSVAVFIYSPLGNVPGKFADNVKPARITENVAKVAVASDSDDGTTFLVTAKFLTFIYDYSNSGILYYAQIAVGKVISLFH